MEMSVIAAKNIANMAYHDWGHHFPSNHNGNAKNQGKIHKTNPLGLKLPFNKWRFCDFTPVCFQMLQNDNP